MRAGVTPGLIRHYFDTKEDLVAAAHETLMNGLTEASAAQLDELPDDPLARLAGFVGNAVSPLSPTRAAWRSGRRRCSWCRVTRRCARFTRRPIWAFADGLKT
ncbi:TetR/AcrR family transcriptional regulator [Pararhodobacter zhoushanensis]|uniref:TetR family transcriptional regulator n=1 Tax=Pararhodobacter zhoushanensis TaxID=2479545 RepID=A0ABT3H116_9RHOB|nr:TetR family transcriptional regulator [Pararhodobacter zhoushanensis]MCW1933468.1 TetR family transcriptional regulator [Pararhodobacter zhoushanensis]